MRTLFYLILLISFNRSFSQEPEDSLKAYSLFHANTQSVHPFGIFISRINNNFQLKADQNISVSVNVSSGNVWLPYVKTYVPENESDRSALKKMAWHDRENPYAALNSPSKTIEFEADGVIRLYQINFNVPISKRQEVKVNSRMFSLSKGNFPTAILTNDQFIESFHSIVLGDNDPFARKAYGFNKAKIRYTDRNGKTMQLKNNDFMYSGIDAAYYYYPKIIQLEKHQVFTTVGVQFGANLNKINPAIDLGLNASAIKKQAFKNKAKLHVGISLAYLRLQAIQLNQGVELYTKNYLLSSEFMLEYVKQLKNKAWLSLANTFSFQSSYFKRNEFDYMVLSGARISSHWHYTQSHLYRTLIGSNLIMTYSKSKYSYSVYLREDFLADNAPDVQAGFGIRRYLK